MKTENMIIVGAVVVGAYWLWMRKPAARYAAPAPVTPKPSPASSAADTVGKILDLAERSFGASGSGSGDDNLVSSDSPGFFDSFSFGGDNLVGE